jgi:hypothetical protein
MKYKGEWWDEIYTRTPDGRESKTITPIKKNLIVASFANMVAARFTGSSYAAGTCSADMLNVTWVSGNNFSGCSGDITIKVGAAYVAYKIASVTDETHLVLQTPVTPPQTAVSFYTGCAGINFHAFGTGDSSWDGSGIVPPYIFDTGLVNEIYRVKPDSITFVKYGDGVAESGSTTTIVDPLRVSNETLMGTCNTNGAAITWISGDVFSSLLGSIVINGVPYTISSVTDTTNLVLTSSAGVQTGVSFVAQSGGVVTGRFEQDGFFTGMYVNITAGTNVGQSRLVTGYHQSSGVIQVSPAFTAAIDDTSEYQFTPIASSTPTTAVEVRTTLDYGSPTDPFNNQYLREQALFGGYATKTAGSGFMLDEIRQPAIWKSVSNRIVKMIRLSSRP